MPDPARPKAEIVAEPGKSKDFWRIEERKPEPDRNM
jgi:hypothetical protein